MTRPIRARGPRFSPLRADQSASTHNRARPTYLLAAAICLLALAPLTYLPLSFVGFVADPRSTFGADSGAFRDYEIRSAWTRLIVSLLTPVLVCLAAGIAVTDRRIGRGGKALGVTLIASAIALALWRLAADVQTLLDTMSAAWHPGL